MKTNYKKVYVEWVDSARNNDWNITGEIDLDVDFKPIEVETIGWLVHETDNYIMVAQSIGYEPEQFCGSMIIPKCSVTKMVNMLRECDLTE